MNAYNYAGDTYDFYLNTHSRDSLDDAGMTLISTVRHCPGGTCPYQNAFWNGSQMAYGDGFAAADDVVGHELTHGVTNFTSNLVYANQSGAINESFSDVWGEFIDLTNSGGTDTAAVRWLMGEDVPGFGAIRNMKTPGDFGDPDKLSSSDYNCGSSDNGGVHTNSGVNNKAAYLMVDGDTFNGTTITGIGINKTAKVYYEAQTNILTSGSTFLDLYNALQVACETLIGTGELTTTECNSVTNAITSVEMNGTNDCVHPPEPPAPVCPAGLTASNLFNDGMENGLTSWTHQAITGTDAWSLSTTSPASGANHIHGNDLGNISDSYIATTTGITLPANAYMRFEHQHDFESAYDGGVVEYSVNNGSWNDAGSLIINNSYNGILSSSFNNPLGGRNAYVGGVLGTYAASRLDLSSLSGSNVKFRFRIGTDSSINDLGWDIDNVQVYTCGNASATSITSPLSGSTLTSSSQLFTWDFNGLSVEQWSLYVGSTAGAFDYDFSGANNNATSTTINNLPMDGSTVYARLWFKVNGNWDKVDAIYTSDGVTNVTITSPASGDILTGSSQLFTWNNNGLVVEQWSLYVGSTAGAYDYGYAGANDNATSATINNLPVDGSTVYAQLWYKVNGNWEKVDATYTASTLTQLTIVSPTSGSTLTGTNQLFTWNNNGLTIEQWGLYVGSTAGAYDYGYAGADDNATSATINNLPIDGSTVYARLWYKVNGIWEKVDATYTATTLAQVTIVSPAPGSTLTNASQIFTWDNNGLAVEQWALYVGSTLGAYDYDYAGANNNAVSTTINNLPLDGNIVYVRLWYKVNNNWEKIDASYLSN
jgi:hypothetical protein